MLFHHCLSICGQLIGLHYGKYGTELAATIFGTELTNPLLQLRWFLRETHRHKTWYSELNDAMFILLFTFLRIVLASYLLYCYLQHPRPDWLGRLGGISIYLVGVGFWIMIVRYAVRKYSKMFHQWRTGKGLPFLPCHRSAFKEGAHNNENQAAPEHSNNNKEKHL